MSESREEPWRIVLENGEVRSVIVESKMFDFGVRYSVVTEYGPSCHDTARGAVIGHCILFNLPVAETVSPGERSRAEITAELAALRAGVAEAIRGFERRAKDCRDLDGRSDVAYGDTAGHERLQAKASAYNHAAEILREETKCDDHLG